MIHLLVSSLLLPILHVLIDTDVTYNCMSKQFILACGLSAENISDLAMCINTPLGLGSLMTRIIRSVDVLVESLHMPVDMLVLLMSNFDVVLGMNWLNQY